MRRNARLLRWNALLFMLASVAQAQTSVNVSPWSQPLQDLRRLGEMGAAAGKQAKDALQTVGVQVPIVGKADLVLAPLSATIDPNKPLTLRQAWTAAMLNDATVRAATAAAASGQERVPQARAQLLPSVQASVSRNLNDIARNGNNSLDQPLQIFDRYRSQGESITLRQPLVREVQRHGLRQAQYLAQDAEATLEREKQNLAVRVAQAYFDALLATDQHRLILSQREFLATQVQASGKALDAGTGTRTDRDEAQARLDLNSAQLLEAEQQLEYSRRQLASLVNQPFGELARVDIDLFRQIPKTAGSLEDWLKRGLDNSPEMRSMEMRRLAAQADVSRAKSAYLPTVDAVAQTQRSNRENASVPQSQFTATTVGVQVTIPLFQGGFVSSTVRQSSAELERAQEVMEVVKQDLHLRIHREYRNISEGQARVAALEVAARSADVALDSARKSFLAGSRTSLDVLNAEQQRMLVSRDLAQARYVCLLSVVRLNALTGDVDHKLMSQIDAAFVN